MYSFSCTATNAIGQCGKSYLELARDIGEAANFATYFTGSPAAESTPHLYISALATWSRDTSLSRNWKKQFSRIPVFTHAKGGIDLPLMTVSTSAPIMAVGFSSDGTRIVSGSVDKSVRVWDASTGVELKELKGHTSVVNSVGFSSDGKRIVSGSYDSSVRVWDALTGVELKKLEGHTSWANSVGFSSDGMRIVSGSSDHSVRVWDVSKICDDHFSWSLADSNWIISSPGQNHLMWVPQEAGLPSPFNILMISRFGFATVDFCRAMIGVNWVHCYTP